jgi:ribosome maturation factor RimP
MDLISQLTMLIEPLLKHEGLSLVRIQFLGQRRPTLQIMIERLDECPVTIDNCVEASRSISAALDIEDLIKDSYKLEVTSPGLDRPLIKETDFQRFVGNEIKFQTYEIKEGQKKFQGFLEQADKEFIQVRLKDKENQLITVNYQEIRQAKLVPKF